MNAFDIALIAAVTLVLGLAIRAVRKRKGGCGCGCAGCTRSCARRGQREKT